MFSGKRCFTKFKNVGCFADMQTSSRPIPELIFTDLDESSTKYSGHKAQLGELDTYLSDLLCRCAELTQELGYEYFGLQNHGETNNINVHSSVASLSVYSKYLIINQMKHITGGFLTYLLYCLNTF